MAKLYTASHVVPLSSGEHHLFYIYDPDDDPTSGDEKIFRERPLNHANLSSF